MNILVVVDMQNDFIDGALGSAQAERIVSGVAEKIRAAAGQGSLIFVTQDTHSGEYLSTLEGKNLPVPHCLRGSEGWRLHEDVRAALEEAAPERLHIIEKPGFGSVELMEQLGRAAAAGPQPPGRWRRSSLWDCVPTSASSPTPCWRRPVSPRFPWLWMPPAARASRPRATRRRWTP